MNSIKKLLAAKTLVHFCARILYSSYAHVGLASFFISVSDDLLHFSLLFSRKSLFDRLVCATLAASLVVVIEAYLLETLLCRTVLASFVTVTRIPNSAHYILFPLRTLH